MLDIKDLTVRFGGLTAVNQVSMHLDEGKIYGLIGPNGAGKTTFFNLISGVCPPTSGEIYFNGTCLNGQKPYQINRAGICRTYQVINLFKKMTVLENVLVGMHGQMQSNFAASLLHTRAERQEEREALEKARQWLDFVGIGHLADKPAGSLPYGEQRLLEIVRALASNPRLILLDEPAAGMNSGEKEILNGFIRKIITELHVTPLVIEHDMKLMMDVCDYIFVLSFGKKIAEGTPEQIQANPEVIAAYLGGE